MTRPLLFALIILVCCSSCDKKNKSKAEASKAENIEVHEVQHTLVNGIDDSNREDRHGEMIVHIKFDFPVQGPVILYESETKFMHALDTLDIRDNKTSFKRELGTGIYWIGIQNDKNVCPVVLNPVEKEIDLYFRSANMTEGYYSDKSVENTAWSKYYVREKLIADRLLGRKKSRAKSSKKEQYDKLIAADETELYHWQAQIIGEFPGTFTSKVLTWKQEPEKTIAAKYWDNIDFNDVSLIRTKVLHERAQSFMRLFGNANEDGFINCIDLMVEKAKVNTQVLDAVLFSLLEGFSQTKYDGVCAYILEHYIYGDGCGAEMSDVLQSRSAGIRNIQYGSVPPNITLPLYSGGRSNLYELAGKNKYTLVWFWSSWCETCKTESPQIQALYDQYKNAGFGMLGVSVDNNKKMWTDAIKNRGFDFPNVCGMNEWDSQVAKDYYVVKTPSMFILDADKKIVFRSTGHINEVENFLKEKFKVS